MEWDAEKQRDTTAKTSVCLPCVHRLIIKNTTNRMQQRIISVIMSYDNMQFNKWYLHF